ncbi:RHS repeat-associated core domain-containing protein [Thermomonas sp.]|uniref:RHS repeat domain-containing protein n=1 Tax=Thermomonas sp. TaxID=1971895 RepID=UPI002C8B6BDD|nr:RHS repeat-associated core domain-containing protein [Thermomonas sp.]HRO62701.1 RHS repeat-associated core domain-containing protein [Thermomonas sp.]
MSQNARQLPSHSVDGSVLDLATVFDANGNVAAITDNTASGRQTRSMSYDGLDRLTQTTSPMFGTASYTYDPQDNLTRVQVTGGSQPRDHTYCYNAANRLEFVRSGPNCSGNASPAVIALGYDLQGNLSFKNNASYAFDFGNRLRATANQNYRYDAQGRRVRQDVAGGQLQYSQYASDGRLVWQRDETTNQRIANAYLAGSLLAEISRPLTGNTTTIRYLHTDALGSPIAKTSATGAIIETSEYEPYGRLLNRANDNRAGYTGHVMDAVSGLTYMQQRYYDPAIGRFLSVDPVTAYSNPVGAFNRYWYANGNPYRFVDLDGRQSRCTGTSCAVVNLLKTLTDTTAAISNISEKVGNFLNAAYEHSDIRVQADGCSGACVSVDQSILHGDGNVSITPIGWSGGNPSGGQGSFLGLIFGPREGVVLSDGAKSGADAPVALTVGGEIKAADGLGFAVQGEVSGSGKTTVNGGFVIGVGEVTKPVGIRLFNWDPLKKKDE